MPPILRNILVVAIGAIIGIVINMSIIRLSASVIAPPEGVDPKNLESIKANIDLYSPIHFIMPFLAHALGTIIGAFFVAKLAASHHMKLALFIGVFFLLGGIQVAFMLGGPIWFCVFDILLAYIPMAFLGWKLAGSPKI